MIVIAISLPLLAGCGNQGYPEVRFVVPDDFAGPLVIVEDESGIEITEESGVFTVEFPDSGVLRVSDDVFLRNPHRMTAYRENNEVIPIYPEGFSEPGLFGTAYTEGGKLYGFYYVGTEQQALSLSKDEYHTLLETEPSDDEIE